MFHNLFPRDDDQEELDGIDMILVARYERGRPEFFSRHFAPDELTELSDLTDRWGGGRYELTARYGGRIVAKQTWDLAGRSLPFTDAAASAGAPAFSAPPPSGGGGEGTFGMILQALTVLGPLWLTSMQSRQKSEELLMTGMMQMVGGQTQQAQAQAQAHVAAMTSLHQSALQQMATLMAQMKGPAAGGREDFERGMEFMEKLQTKISEGAEKEDILEDLGKVAQIWNQMQTAAAAAQPHHAPTEAAAE